MQLSKLIFRLPYYSDIATVIFVNIPRLECTELQILSS